MSTRHGPRRGANFVGKPGDEMLAQYDRPAEGDLDFDDGRAEARQAAKARAAERKIAAQLGIATGSLPSAAGGGRAATGQQRVVVERGADAMEVTSYTPQAELAVGEAGVAAGEGEGSRITMSAFKRRSEALAREFLRSFDVNQAAITLRALGAPFFRFEFVRKLLTEAMSASSDSAREWTCRLLSGLYGEGLLDMAQTSKGFERTLELLGDIRIDVPAAPELMSKFLARAVADEILPPAFLMDECVQRLGGPVVDRAKALLTGEHALARMEKVWGVGAAALDVSDLKEAVRMLVEEFLSAGDVGEAARCVAELESPSYGHEVVKRLVVTAMGRSAEARDRAHDLLAQLHQRDLLGPEQLLQGVRRVRSELADIQLDVPSARLLFGEMVDRMVAAELLAADADIESASPLAVAAQKRAEQHRALAAAVSELEEARVPVPEALQQALADATAAVEADRAAAAAAAQE